jgi:hypothetical protein
MQDASVTMGANLALARRKKNWLPLSSNSRVEFSQFWHMIDWFSTACCLYGARLTNENRS